MSQHQHPLFSDPEWTDGYAAGQRIRSTLTDNEGVVEIVKHGRYLLIRWQRPTVHLTRHHSPLGLVAA